MLDFRIETFLTVCQCMNFTRASEELNITQPAVSQHIRYLEKHYGVKLFGYEGKKPKLTPAGEMLRSAALTMMHDEISLENQLKHVTEGFRDIRFGATMTVGEIVMARILKRYLTVYPDAHLHMEVGNTQELLYKLDHGEIDFAIVEGYFKGDNYQTRIFQSEEYIAVASKDHVFQKPVTALRDLTSERLLLREHGSGTRAILTKTLALKNMSIYDFPHIIEVENIHTIVSLLCEDCGISFLYKAAVEKEIQQGILKQIPLSDFMVMHDFTFIWNKDSIFSEEYEGIFQELLRLSNRNK